ncbi:VOC family protein [Streptomyces somaliensis]|uniref:VOC family protein n=1 Tax=Streptomyces somaliensis TaxID=78355 RepID=UPI0020CC045E|nr:VOC family protein [Streptomyces somaliensis]MCP9945386.1 VOC family protein [Streptomyces somaliensis]MCP9961409.1 VOC family protein [Streptomyces somaliensis]MCP9974216.1 VOC family protein [Streptomyces somaliensis]
MPVELNHTIVAARDRRESAEFLAHILGLEVGPEMGPFLPVQTANGVTLDFATFPEEDITSQHYAFLVSEAEFDAAFERIRQAGIAYWADPRRTRPGEINRNDGGRGLYFADPSDQFMEIITRPYGSGGAPAS